MPVPPAGHSSSTDSTSTCASSESSLFAPPFESVSSQSDIADPLLQSMPRGDASAYTVAASPSQAANNPAGSAASASQKFKRAFAKRRKPSQAPTSLLSSGDERSASDTVQFPSSSQTLSKTGVGNHSDSRPSAVKLTMHLFGGRRAPHSGHDHPPPLPPKPAAMRRPAPPALQNIERIAEKLTTNAGATKHGSVMATSPSINPAIQYMREDELHQRSMGQLMSDPSAGELEQNKEDWRKSDSTVASNHTLRPSLPEVTPNPGANRRSTLSTSPITGDLGPDLSLSSGVPIDASALDLGNQVKRRSISINIPVAPPLPSPPIPGATPTTYIPPPSSHRIPGSIISESHPTPSIGSMHSTHSPSHSISLTPPLRDIPTLTHAAANGIIGSGTASGSPVNKTNIRGRLAARTAASGSGVRSTSPHGAPSMSSPSLSGPSATSVNQDTHRRIPFTSNASQPLSELQAITAVREIQNRTRSPSTPSVAAAGIRQAASSLTSGASAMALGFGKRAYEKVGRVWASAGSSSGNEAPNNHHSSPAVAGGREDTQHRPHHGPSAFPGHAKRTQNAPSGTWSVTSLSGGSRSSSERDGRNTPPNGLGKLIRSPRNTGGSIVFGRELWECVRETRATVSASHPLAGRMIPALVLRCAQHLRKWGIQEEGLFRISGRSSHINRLRHEFDSGADYDIIDCPPSELDPHAVASVFKAYLRELPEPILTRALTPLFDAAMNAESSRVPPSSPSAFMPKSLGASGSILPSNPRAHPMVRKPPSLSTFTLPNSATLRAPSTSLLEALGDLVARLPRENRDLLLTVVELMQTTAAQSKETKMPLSNLLLVFCPSLSMSPTLLRVLCDSRGIWKRVLEPPVMESAVLPNTRRDEDEENDDTDSDSVSSHGEAQTVEGPPTHTGAEGERGVSGESGNAQTEVPISLPNAVEPLKTESPVSPPVARPRAVRRVPVPALLFDEQQLDQKSPLSNSNRSPTPPPVSDSSPQSPLGSVSASASALTLSLQVPSRSMTPVSALTPISAPALESGPMVPPLRSRQFSSPLPSSGYISMPLTAPNHNKDLPASPRSLSHPEDEDRVGNTLPLHITTDVQKRKSRPLPQIPPSHSAPSVVFPSVKTPTTPTSLKKHAISLTSVRQAKLSSDDGSLPSPARRMGRRPSLNMLFNMKRSRSPSPRTRTPTISSPLSTSPPIALSPSCAGSSPWTVTDHLPPVLSLPSLETSADTGLGLGWDEVFTTSSGSETTLSQPPPQSPRPPTQPQEPPPQSQQPPTDSPQPTESPRPPTESPRQQTQPLEPTPPPEQPTQLPEQPTQPPEQPTQLLEQPTQPPESLIDSPQPPTQSPQPLQSQQPQPTVISEPSSQPPLLQTPPSTPQRPTEVLSSGGFFGPNGPPFALPSPTSVLEAANISIDTQALSSREGDSEPAVLLEDSSSGPDSPEVYSPMKDLFTPPPHLSFQLRRSSMEDEDWATAVLVAAGKPAEPVA